MTLKFRNKLIKDILNDPYNATLLKMHGKESLRWYAKQVRHIKTTPSEFFNNYNRDDMKTPSQIGIGNMYVFNYNPKHKEKLPYYDRMPCIFIFNITSKGFFGINLHYLPYNYRIILMEELYKLETNAKLNKNKKLQLTWQKLKAFTNFKLVQPCVKQYLFSHVKSKLIKIPYEEWGMVSMMPLAQWEKKKQAEIWKESINK